MALDNYSDNTGETTLAEDVDGSETVITVASAAALPSPPFPLLLTADSLTAGEWVRVTGVASNDLTVVRGSYGTSATTHSNGAKVRHGVPMQSVRGLGPPAPPHQTTNAIILPPAVTGWGNITPSDQRLTLSWLPIAETLVNPNIGVAVTTAGTEGSGAAFRCVLYDADGDLVVNELVTVTSTGLRVAAYSGVIPPGWYLIGSLKVGTWSVEPQMRGGYGIYDGNRYYQFNAVGDFGERRPFGLDSQSSVPSTVNVQTLPVSFDAPSVFLQVT